MTARNRSQWLHIAAALDADPMRDLAAHARAIGRASAAPSSPSLLINTGTRRRANSPARAAGAMGQGYGAAGPMSTVVRLVPSSLLAALRATAQGIVTRMGQDPQGLGGEAIEPGPEGMRPVVSVSLAAAARVGTAESAAPGAGKQRAATGAAAFHTPPSNTGVNKVSEKWA